LRKAQAKLVFPDRGFAIGDFSNATDTPSITCRVMSAAPLQNDPYIVFELGFPVESPSDAIMIDRDPSRHDVNKPHMHHVHFKFLKGQFRVNSFPITDELRVFLSPRETESSSGDKWHVLVVEGSPTVEGVPFPLYGPEQFRSMVVDEQPIEGDISSSNLFVEHRYIFIVKNKTEAGRIEYVGARVHALPGFVDYMVDRK
jgi:hypothetical protein